MYGIYNHILRSNILYCLRLVSHINFIQITNLLLKITLFIYSALKTEKEKLKDKLIYRFF